MQHPMTVGGHDVSLSQATHVTDARAGAASPSPVLKAPLPEATSAPSWPTHWPAGPTPRSPARVCRLCAQRAPERKGNSRVLSSEREVVSTGERGPKRCG
ncbi:unnamed protein product [Rangifer tarandus platyrhynchus]|uniref:Uncharacterized protein n=1 Tax=Rangifer tarandus platyrhynchus TaxID=3082113 RepID=A0ABN8YAT0_RANTA|nr:unnamed protein product [Rangifer tarandus platyrhynchus]